MDKQVNLYEAKTRLSELVEEAASGAEIVIAKNGKPKARLVPVGVPATGKRVGGQWAQPGQTEIQDRAAWLREWKAMDAQIERDFYKGMEEDEKPWRGTSSTPMRSSGSKPAPRRSARKRGEKSKGRKTSSS
jgi:prevent-host-death family protein